MSIQSLIFEDKKRGEKKGEESNNKWKKSQ